MQQYAGIYLLQNHSTCFAGPLHPSSGVHKTLTAASDTGHSIWATKNKVVAQILWPVPEDVVTVLCTPDDGCDGHPKHVEWFCSKQIPAYCCILLDLINIDIHTKLSSNGFVQIDQWHWHLTKWGTRTGTCCPNFSADLGGTEYERSSLNDWTVGVSFVKTGAVKAAFFLTESTKFCLSSLHSTFG